MDPGLAYILSYCACVRHSACSDPPGGRRCATTSPPPSFTHRNGMAVTNTCCNSELGRGARLVHPSLGGERGQLTLVYLLLPASTGPELHHCPIVTSRSPFSCLKYSTKNSLPSVCLRKSNYGHYFTCPALQASRLCFTEPDCLLTLLPPHNWWWLSVGRTCTSYINTQVEKQQ